MSSTPWWRARRDALLALAADRSPRYVYDLATVRQRARDLRAAVPADRVHYAVKANDHPDILRALAGEGLDLECVSVHEIEHVLAAVPGVRAERVLYTPNFAGRDEVARALDLGVHATVDNAATLDAWAEVWAGREVSVRVDPGVGKGHHDHVKTAGDASKFGVSPADLPALAEAAGRHGVRIVGLHAHTGSGYDDLGVWAENARLLGRLAGEHFPDVRHVNVGGGIPVPTGDAPPYDLAAAGAALGEARAAFPGLAVWIEPGRFLVAEAGVLLARVTQVKRKGAVRYVGLDAGMNSLLRPALYGAHHDVVNLSRLDAPPAGPAEIVGPICESSDVLARARPFPETEEGDVVLVDTAGAYGFVMASHYNRRPPAEEVAL